MKLSPERSTDVTTLAALGLAPHTRLMTEPRLFQDRELLSALIVELEDELGFALAARTLFVVGLIHGLRDGSRAVDHEFASVDASEYSPPVAGPCGAGPAMALDLSCVGSEGGAYEIEGSWPEGHEVAAWTDPLGPGEEPSCWLSSGYTSGWLSSTLGGNLIALERSCRGCGDATCSFEARDQERWSTRPRNAQLELLGDVDFDLFRTLALDASDAVPELIEGEGEFDPEGPMVHIWGPVMILPYTTRENLLRTTDALGRDPSTNEINAVVLDLRNEALDEGFDTEAVEQVLESIEAWGAEPILTGVSPMSEHVIAECESQHLLVRKDLDEAIAAAFLITEAQRYAA